MARSHTPLSVWFWSAYLVSSQTPGMSAVQLRRQLGLSRYETAFQILRKLRAGMVRPRIRTGSAAGPASTSKSMKPGLAAGRAATAVASHDKVLRRQRCAGSRSASRCTKLDQAEGWSLCRAGSLAIVPDRSAESLCGFEKCAVVPARRSSPTTGAATPALPSTATNASPSLNGRDRRCQASVPINDSVFANAENVAERAAITGSVTSTGKPNSTNSLIRFNRRFIAFNAFRSRRHRARLTDRPRRTLLGAGRPYMLGMCVTTG